MKPIPSPLTPKINKQVTFKYANCWQFSLHSLNGSAFSSCNFILSPAFNKYVHISAIYIICGMWWGNVGAQLDSDCLQPLLHNKQCRQKQYAAADAAQMQAGQIKPTKNSVQPEWMPALWARVFMQGRNFLCFHQIPHDISTANSGLYTENSSIS